MTLIICVKNYEYTQVVFNPIKSISVMELIKHETILSLCIESLRPSFILGDKEELMKERVCLEKATKNGEQPEKGAEKKHKYPDDSNTELQQCEKSKKRNDDKENGQKAKEKEAKKKKKNKDRICYCRQENHKLLHDGHLSVLLQITTTKWKKR